MAADVNNDQLLATVNGTRSKGRRAALAVGGAVLLVVVLVAGALAGVAVRDWWALRAQNQANINAAVMILQYNLQQGKLAMPPQLSAQAAQATPSPAGANTAAPKAEAPPDKK